MYYVFLENHSYSYEIYEIVTLYYPGEKIIVCDINEKLPEDCMVIKSSISIEANTVYSNCILQHVKDGEFRQIEFVSGNCPVETDIKKSVKHCVKLTVFKLFKSITGIEMPWGILVGIRPSKIVNELKNRNTKSTEIKSILKNKYLLRDDKIQLVTQVSDNSNELINTDKKNVSIYIGIPFCPTKCIYCSFASYPIHGYLDQVGNYIESLKYEIDKVSRFVRDNFKIDTVYIGGGTPTSLDDNSFKELIEYISANIDINHVREFTVEAGRPDTINRFKLEVMKDNGVSRVSINPQTMNEDTLKRIGRNHTVKDIYEKYGMAREYGFNNINMDIILGLPREEIMNVRETLDKILQLSPENITVHTMAVKRASKLKEKIIEKENVSLPESSVINGMMDLVHMGMYDGGYKPYYMYRQKMTVGNLENVGYCKDGFECLYNIQMIEEKETIIGIGADAVTKFVFHDQNRIERFANKKDLKEYINTIHENVDKKLSLLSMLT